MGPSRQRCVRGGFHINRSRPARTPSLGRSPRISLAASSLASYLVPQGRRMPSGGARCAQDCKAGAQATLVASGPRGLPLPLYSARPAPRAGRAPPGSIHLLLRTRHRSAQSEPPTGPWGPAVGAGRAGAPPRQIQFPPFLKCAAESGAGLGSQRCFLHPPPPTPRGCRRTLTPPTPLREGPRNYTRKSLIHILGSRPGR